MKIIAFVSNKGGVSKTTSTMNLGHSLAAKGKKVLLIDLDAQANLSQTYNLVEPQNHIGKVLLGDISASKAIIKGAVDVIPAASELLSCEEQLNTRLRREYALKKALNPLLQNYDYILLDTPPHLGLATNNALFASDHFVIPVVAEYYSYTGIRRIVSHVQDNDIDTNLAGILLTRFHPNTRARVMQAMVEKLKESGLHVFSTTIRQSVRVIESQLKKQSLLDYDPESTAAQDYLTFADELTKELVTV